MFKFCTLTTVINGRELKYDIETNEIWAIDGRSKKWVVKTLWEKSTGYVELDISDKTYKHHRVIYKFYNPTWDIDDGSQDNSIDHINGTKNDNQIVNLRNVTNQQNQFNTNACGCIWVECMKKWRARIRVSGKLIHLGYFDLKEDARNAYLEAKKVHHIITPIRELTVGNQFSLVPHAARDQSQMCQ